MKTTKNVPNYLAIITIIFFIIIVFIIIITLIKANQEKNKLPISDAIRSEVKIESGIVSLAQEQTLYQPEIDNNSPILGDARAPISIFEYSSFSCPNSGQIQPILESIIKSYQGKVKLIWKDLPLTEEYPNALIAHTAARCAQKQNKFWEYAKLLWQSDKNFSNSQMMSLAQKINLDMASFKTCLENEDIKNLVAKDEKEANALAIPGTPHFYINTQEISGVGSIDDFKKIINAELARKNIK